jgi:ankyrin repeat protein
MHVHARGGYHKTQLNVAFNNRHPSIVLLLMNHGADVTSRGHHGQTALYVASSRGNIEFVQLLLDHGADLNLVCNGEDSFGQREAHSATCGVEEWKPGDYKGTFGARGQRELQGQS